MVVEPRCEFGFPIPRALDASKMDQKIGERPATESAVFPGVDLPRLGQLLALFTKTPDSEQLPQLMDKPPH